MHAEFPNLADIWELAKAAGPFGTGLMLLLYLRVDRERKAMTRELIDVTKNATTVSETWLKILEKTKIKEGKP